MEIRSIIIATLVESPPAPTVLVVDDEPELLRFVAAVLERRGMRVITAHGSAQALQVMEHTEMPPDLLLTDVVMPGVSGPMLLDQLSQRFPQLRVLFMSGYEARTIVQRYVVDQGYPLLPKPFTVEQLREKVKSVMEEPPGPHVS